MRFRRDLFVCCFTSTSSDTMQKAKHMSVYRCASHHEESLQLTECLSNGNLAAHLRSEMDENITLPWLKRLDMAIDIANPLDHLNNYGIIHRNVKSSNFLLDVNCCAKVGNLHLLQKLPDGVPVDATHVTSDRAGSSGYMDPEYLTKGQLSVKNDVYSFGVVLCELLSSKLAKDWVLNEVDNLVSILSRKIENQALVELLDPRLGFESNLKIKQVMTVTAKLALKRMKLMSTRIKISVLKIFHGAELEEATNNFDTCLGKGGYGSIYYGKLGREVAVKCFHVENETEETIKQFMKETAILSLLHHQNLHNRLNIAVETSAALVFLHDSGHATHVSTIPVGTRAYIDPDYYESGRISVLKIFHGAELEEATNNFDTCLGKGGYGSIYYGKLGREVAVKCFHVENETEETIKQFMKETAILSLLHHQNLHNRLNIAVETSAALVFLHDSGHATHVSTIPVGTRAYIDPDYYESGRVSHKSDVYSFGLVLFKLISSIRQV
ncbi:Putative serine/threonine-protein kinase [Glycine soja]|nr:Putative serine/threonine-protein kinase [Glycine soja]